MSASDLDLLREEVQGVVGRLDALVRRLANAVHFAEWDEVDEATSALQAETDRLRSAVTPLGGE